MIKSKEYGIGQVLQMITTIGYIFHYLLTEMNPIEMPINLLFKYIHSPIVYYLIHEYEYYHLTLEMFSHQFIEHHNTIIIMIHMYVLY